LLDILEILCHL